MSGINDHLPADAIGSTWGPPIGGGFPTAEIAVHVHQITVKLDAWYAANADRVVNDTWSGEVQAWLALAPFLDALEGILDALEGVKEPA